MKFQTLSQEEIVRGIPFLHFATCSNQNIKYYNSEFKRFLLMR